MLDDAAEFLRRAGQEPRHVFERDERDVERVAEPHEPRAFDRRVNVEHTGEMRRLIRDDTYRSSAEPRETDDEVAREMLVHFEKGAVIGDRVDQIEHVVWLIRRRRNETIQRVI